MWSIFLVFALFRLSDSCNATRQCTYPSDNAYTVNYTVTSDGRHIVNASLVHDCCAIMPVVPLVDTGAGSLARIREPPSMDAAGVICPSWPEDVMLVQGLSPWRNASLYSRPKVFFSDGLDHDSAGVGHFMPTTGLPGCRKPHPFYTKYLLARSEDCSVAEGIPVLGSKNAPDAAMLKAGETIAEMLRQIDGKLPGLRRSMVQHAQRFAVWPDAERRLDTCELCKTIDPFFDCHSHIDSRAGRDTSYHPEVPQCVEGGGGGGLSMPTSFTEEYGIPYLEADGTVRDSFCGTNVVAHEFFHSIHDVGIQDVARPLFLRIERAAARAVREGLYVHHPGARDDGCNDDFTRCVAYEFIVKAHMLWNGFPADPREFPYRSRSEMKAKAPWIAELVFEMFEDGTWNPSLGAVIETPRDQTFGLACRTAPGSALCGAPLSAEYVGPPMAEVLARCGGSCWTEGDRSHPPHVPSSLLLV
ncbi:unnamed protein product [Prorocentrum cordatum]|uniref:Lysine-specific metallo-endopeptidase domain-containing protein n=1 Tax=Prorocentrum cordatum TaxID=2364126 RepID=A0ABN9QTK5_9DINO|nr:unnamed protein product [Polarella glacialis]